MEPFKHITGRKWYAVYTRSRAEKKVASEFTVIGIEHYLPLRWTLRQWSDRKKKVLIPLISSYVFVRISRNEHAQLFDVLGVVKIVHFCGRPVPIPDWQIRNLKILMGAQVPLSDELSAFEPGQEVHITKGPLQGLRGMIQKIKGRRKLVISVNALEYDLTIDIASGYVELL